MDLIVPVIAIISVFGILPAIIAASVLASKVLKLRREELDLRRLELEAERERIEVLRLMERNDAHDRLIAEEGRDLSRGRP